jgi:ankyrin repeat protein
MATYSVSISTTDEGRKVDCALQWAAYEGRVEVTRALLESGIPVNGTDSAGVTALHLAAQQGHSEVSQIHVQLFEGF